MFAETHITKSIQAQILKDFSEERAKHNPSGKLSAGMLGSPLQWQVLKTLGVPERELETETLLKFLRGKHVEEWFIKQIPGVVETQKFCEYRGAIGYMDVLVSSTGYDFDFGIIPHEIKSVTRDKFKRIQQKGSPDPSHLLQAGFYAIATGYSHFAIDYVNTSDYRVLTWVYPVSQVKKQIDGIIDKYNEQLTSGKVPKFEAKYAWQKDPLYNKFPRWSALTEKECQTELKKFYPEAWDKVLILKKKEKNA